MGEDLDQRAWEQVADALANIERVERGSPGHAAFTAYARGLLQPVAARLGWQSSPDETPGLQQLRRRVLSNLGAWGDDGVIAEARRRFGRFLADRASLGPDDQSAILSVVARNADADDFARLHALAQSAGNETELRRYYSALMQVRAPALAAQAGAIALSPEIPAQAEALRLQLVIGLHDENPTLSWSLFAGNIDRLMAPEASFAPLIIAQYSPDIFWNAVPIDALQAWVTAHVPAEMSDNVARGMESARFKVAQKQALTAATDRYVASLGKSGAGR
jgi:aminopeptidase N